jgi:energy-coupling factor transport system permease protein
MINLRYRDKGTPLHRLHPVAKVGWAVAVLVVALVVDSPAFLLALFLATLPLVGAARVWREWGSLMKLTLYLAGAIIIINALVSSHGSHVLVTLPGSLPLVGTPVITLEAIIYGAVMSMRLAAIISAFALVTFTVSPDDIMAAMLKVRLPYKSVLVVSLSTRFVPTLIDDTARLSDVQRARGLELDRGRFGERIRSRSTITMALLANSLDRAVQVAEAMESRAFGGSQRTYYRDSGFTVTDVASVVLPLLVIALAVFMGLNGYGQYQYYPALAGFHPSPTEWALLAIMVGLLVSPGPLALIKRRRDLD